ncbi:MAG: hypothetical protein MJ106_07735 [Lentisphaeria bacterium]|nr:hypothetical protein [Lentisphaeria bacterium]
MDLKWILVMCVGAIIGFIGKKHQNAGWGQALLILGAVVAITGAAFNLVGFTKSGNKAVKTENRFRYIQGKILAENMKKACFPSKVCVIVNPLCFLDKWGDPLPTVNEIGFLEGVQDALGNCEVIPVYPEFSHKKTTNQGRGQDFIPYSTMPFKDYQKVVSKIKKEKPDCVINTYMFPPDAPLTKSLAELKGYKVGMLNTDFNKKSDAELTAAFKSGGDLLFVVQQRASGFDSEDQASSDQKSFDIRYVLVTGNNCEQALKEANERRK